MDEFLIEDNSAMPSIEEQVAVNSIKASANDANVLNAFDMEVLNKNGGQVKVKLQKNHGSVIPTIVGKNHTDLNQIKPTIYKGSIAIYQLAHELELDINQVEDGVINVSQAIADVQADLQIISTSLMLTGRIQAEATGQQLHLVKNSLFDVGLKTTSNINFASSSANVIGAFVNSRIEAVEQVTGEAPDTLVISSSVWRQMATASTNLSEFIIWDYLRNTLGLQVYQTSFLNDVNTNKACMVLFKKDPAKLKGYIGKPPFVRNNKTTNTNDYPAILTSIAGFANFTGSSGSVDITTNLLQA